MNDTPTPETDAAEMTASTIAVNLPPASARFVHAEFARKLERERDEEREKLAAALVRAENAEQDRVQADTDSIRALHERNELREQLKNSRGQSIALGDIVDDLRAQLVAERALADRLADALVDIQDRASDATIMLHPDDESKGCIDDCWEWSEQALNTWKEARKS